MTAPRSFVNLAVILGIVLTCGSLLAVAVLKVRAAAHQQLCASNLRAVAIAVHNHHNDYDYFPPPTVSNPRLPIDRRLSWYAQIWPYFEATTLKLDKNAAWNESVNRSPRFYGMDAKDPGVDALGPMECWLCPRNPNRGDRQSISLTHYVGITGLGEDAEDLPLDDPRAGFFGHGRKITLKYIQSKDGTSNTMMVAETSWDNGPWLAGGRPTLRCLDPQGPAYVGRGGQFGCGTFHTNVVMADCSTRPFRLDVDRKVLEALVTMAGGEAVPWIE